MSGYCGDRIGKPCPDEWSLLLERGAYVEPGVRVSVPAQPGPLGFGRPVLDS